MSDPQILELINRLQNEARERHAVNLEGDPIRFRDARLEDDTRWQAAIALSELIGAPSKAEQKR